MDHPQPYTDEALRQRFRELSESLQHVHASWREAYRQQDIGRQLELIDREHAIVAELRELIVIFQQTLHERLACLRRPPVRKP